MKQLLEAATMAVACYISEHEKGRPTSTGEFGGRRGWRVRLTPTVATRWDTGHAGPTEVAHFGWDPGQTREFYSNLVLEVNFTITLAVQIYTRDSYKVATENSSKKFAPIFTVFPIAKEYLQYISIYYWCKYSVFASLLH